MKPRTLILALLALVAVAALGWAASVEDHRYDPLTTSLARQLRAQMVDQPLVVLRKHGKRLRRLHRQAEAGLCSRPADRGGILRTSASALLHNRLTT